MSVTCINRMHLGSAILAALLMQAAVPSHAAPASASQISLCVETTVVTAISQPEGDYESIKRIESVAPERIRLKYSAEAMVKDELSDEPAKLVKWTMYRTMLTKDLNTAR